MGDRPRLKLAGEFDRHFSLHVPPGYERDALYLFTPDVLAALLEEARDFALEIVDGWAFLYTRRLDLTKPHTHERMWRLAEVIGGELRHQADGYRDERLVRDPREPLNVDRIALASRRLPTFVWIPGVLLAVAVATSPFWGLFAGAIERMLVG